MTISFIEEGVGKKITFCEGGSRLSLLTLCLLYGAKTMQRFLKLGNYLLVTSVSLGMGLWTLACK